MSRRFHFHDAADKAIVGLGAFGITAGLTLGGIGVATGLHEHRHADSPGHVVPIGKTPVYVP